MRLQRSGSPALARSGTTIKILMFWRVCFALPICQAILFAELTNSVTVNASQLAGQPDSVVFSVAVTSGYDQTLENIVNAVSGLGITAANLTGLGMPNAVLYPTSPLPRSGPPQEQWTFQLVVPFAQMKSTSTTLAMFQKSLAQSTSSLILSWSVSGIQTSAATCNLPSLAAQASAQAQQIAATASVKLGAISRLSISGCALTASYALSTAQPGPRTLLATASQPITGAAPDQVTVELCVTSPLTATLSSITAALKKAGITGVTFSGAGENSQRSPLGQALSWTFSETVPIPNLVATLAQLTAAERHLGGLHLTFGPAGVSYSQPPACPEATLVSQAQMLAQNAAAAAGGSAGPLLSMSSAAGLVPTEAFRSGNFSAVETVAAVGIVTSIPSFELFTPPPATCSLTAQFQLL
jgi:hypothetical protein